MQELGKHRLKFYLCMRLYGQFCISPGLLLLPVLALTQASYLLFFLSLTPSATGLLAVCHRLQKHRVPASGKAVRCKTQGQGDRPNIPSRTHPPHPRSHFQKKKKKKISPARTKVGYKCKQTHINLNTSSSLPQHKALESWRKWLRAQETHRQTRALHRQKSSS